MSHKRPPAGLGWDQGASLFPAEWTLDDYAFLSTAGCVPSFQGYERTLMLHE